MNDITLRPGFDIITMIEEWRTALESGGYSYSGPKAAGLISTLVSRHMTLFRMDLVQMGLLWNEMEGQVYINPAMADAIAKGFVDHPRVDVVDLSWTDCFDEVFDDVDEIVEFLCRSGEL